MQSCPETIYLTLWRVHLYILSLWQKGGCCVSDQEENIFFQSADQCCVIFCASWANLKQEEEFFVTKMIPKVHDIVKILI